MGKGIHILLSLECNMQCIAFHEKLDFKILASFLVRYSQTAPNFWIVKKNDEKSLYSCMLYACRNTTILYIYFHGSIKYIIKWDLSFTGTKRQKDKQT